MAFPSTLKSLGESGFQNIIEGALAVTRKPIIVGLGEDYRDDPVQLLNAAGYHTDLGGSTIGSGEVQYGAGVGVYTGFGEALDPSGTVSSTPLTYAADPVLHIAPRVRVKLHTLIQWWDAATPGHAMTMSVTTTSGSATVTVPSARRLTPGQGITGTGIPAGTTIESIFSIVNGIVTETVAVLSQQATATGTAAATLTGANLLGEQLQAEWLQWGSDNTTPI
jgi:hypothetical protein